MPVLEVCHLSSSSFYHQQSSVCYLFIDTNYNILSFLNNGIYYILKKLSLSIFVT